MSLYKFGRDHSYQYAYILESRFVVHFLTRCCLKFFLPYGGMLTKTKKMAFRQSLYNLLVETLPKSIHGFLGVNM